MMIVRRTSPFGELLSLRQAMDRLFDETLRPFAGSAAVTFQACPRRPHDA